MKIGLLGYGKMGKAIEEIATSRGHSIVLRCSSTNPIETIDLSLADIFIEFTQPDLAVKHIEHCIQAGKPIVVGTTAWQSDLPKLVAHVNSSNGSLLHASNFSIGVNLMFLLNEKLAKLMNQYKEYTAEISEVHHLQKLDHPSGTAVSLAQGIISNSNYYERYHAALNQLPEPLDTSIPIEAIRKPDIPGTHHVQWNSEVDQITLSHQAHNRNGFALGAVIAAEFLVDKKGVFSMRDVFEINSL
jgi:4-hydroxy-tetrahydrodipicolinate reductase